MKIKFLERLKAKKALGMVAVVLGLTLASVAAVPITRWVLSLNAQATLTETRLQEMTLAYDQFKQLNQLPFDDLEDKQGQTETETAVDSNYEIKTTYGSKQKVDPRKSDDEASWYIPISIEVTRKNDPTVQPYGLKSKVISSNDGGSAVGYGDKIPRSGKVLADGFLVISRSNGGHGHSDVIINGQKISDFSGDGKYGGSDHITTIPIAKGSVYTIGSWGIHDIYFFPLNGKRGQVQDHAPQAADDSTDDKQDVLDNSYVQNDYDGHRIHLNYDESSKSLKAYVDDNEVEFGSDAPSPDMFSDNGGYYKFPNGLIMQWGYTAPLWFP